MLAMRTNEILFALLAFGCCQGQRDALQRQLAAATERDEGQRAEIQRTLQEVIENFSAARLLNSGMLCFWL
jgi:hypothetical protein